MNRIILTIGLILPMTTALAVEVKCPDESFQHKEVVDGNTVTFCKKWISKSKGLFEKGGKEAINHGPYFVMKDGKVILAGEFKDNTQLPIQKRYYPSGSLAAEYEIDKDGKMNGSFTAYYESGGKKITGRYTSGNPGEKFQAFSEQGAQLIEGTLADAETALKKETDKQYELAAKTESDTKAALEKHLTEIKKNWTQKKQNDVTTFVDKKSKHVWTGLVGTSNFYNASLKCRGLKMRLPTSSELQEAYDSGLMEIANDLLQPLWTSVDNTVETNPQRSLALADHSAWQFVPGQGEIPGNKLQSQAAVICTK